MTKMYAESSDLSAVAAAIRAKSGGSSSLLFPSGFISEIGNINLGISVEDYDYFFANNVREDEISSILPHAHPTSMNNLFLNSTNIGAVDFTGINSDRLVSIGGLFAMASGVTSLSGLEDLDMSQVTGATYVFQQAAGSAFDYFVLPAWDFTILTTADHFFREMASTVIDASLMSFPVATSALGFFYHCGQATKLALPHDFSAITASSSMFAGCSSLTELIITDDAAVLPANGTYVFYNSGIEAGTCEIYVPDSLVSAYQAATNWAPYASHIHALSDYPGTKWWAYTAA